MDQDIQISLRVSWNETKTGVFSVKKKKKKKKNALKISSLNVANNTVFHPKIKNWPLNMFIDVSTLCF